MSTEIEWATATWPIVDGCSEATAEFDGKVVMDEACRNCWARQEMGTRHAHLERFQGLTTRPMLDGVLGNPKWTGEVRFQHDKIEEPLRRKKRERYFVASRGDIGNPLVRWQDRAAIYGVMAAAHWHTFLTLTKRADEMRRWMEWLADDADAVYYGRLREQSILHEAVKRVMGYDHPRRPAVNLRQWPLPNVWSGFTAGDQRFFDHRWADAKHWPTAVVWASLEPLFERVTLPADFLLRGKDAWIVVGCESGPKRRDFDINAVRYVRDQCAEAGVSFYFKQGFDEKRKVVSLPVLDGRKWEEFPR